MQSEELQDENIEAVNTNTNRQDTVIDSRDQELTFNGMETTEDHNYETNNNNDQEGKTNQKKNSMKIMI